MWKAVDGDHPTLLDLALKGAVAMEALFEKEIFCEFFDSLAFPVGVLGTDQRFLAANRAFIETYGKGLGDVVGKTCYNVLFHSEEPCNPLGCPFPLLFAEKRAVTIEKQIVHSDGVAAWEEITCEPILGKSGQISHIVATMRDISRFRRVEKKLRKTRDFFEKIIASSVNPIIVADMEGKIILMNESARQLFGYPDLEGPIGIDVDKHYPPGEGKGIMKKLRSKDSGGVGKLHYMETMVRDVNGFEIPVEITASIIYENGEEVATMAILQDLRPRIEAEKRLEKARMQLIQSEKLASVGRLAAGVAHELNNPLGGILMYAHLLLEDLQEEEQIKKTLLKVIDQAERCKRIVKGLLDFSRQAEPETKELDINEVLRETLSIVEAQSLFQDIEIRKELGSTLPPIVGDRWQLQQVFMNLALNAAEAMEGKGILTIETGLEGGSVIIRVKDTGCGIAPENISKIFEPFFSTKSDDNKGTGLGLAVSHGIIATHGGSISVDSVAGKGSTFTIRFPPKDGMNPSKYPKGIDA
ncbi:MAG TPA: PAS domain S-box protein [Desulfobacteraceae bacterium]|nr:PAS domain S-box protein [Desulfobacteraceae bacterium]